MPRLVPSGNKASPAASHADRIIVKMPTDNDILPGRGKHVYSHQGNNTFLSLVKKYEFKNISCPKALKPVYAKAIYTCICKLDPPGRFLKAASQEDGNEEWHEMSQEEALTKIRQAMRDNTIRIKRKKRHDEIKSKCGINPVNKAPPHSVNVSIAFLQKSVPSNFQKHVNCGEILQYPLRVPFFHGQIEQTSSLPVYQAKAIQNIQRHNMMFFPSHLHDMYSTQNAQMEGNLHLKSNFSMPHYYMQRQNVQKLSRFIGRP